MQTHPDSGRGTVSVILSLRALALDLCALLFGDLHSGKPLHDLCRRLLAQAKASSPQSSPNPCTLS